MSKCKKTEYLRSQDEVQPWHRLGWMEHICELRKSSSVLYSILVTILRVIYSSKKGRTFGCPDVVWNKDSQKTQIWVDTELRWEDQRPDFVPAIYISLGDIQYSIPPTLDMQGRLFMNNAGEQQYERQGICTASIVHVCNKSGEACALADNTENYLSSLQGQIASQYCFNNFMVTGRTPLRKKEQSQTAGKEQIVSVVNVKFSWSDAWFVKFESPILKEVTMNDTDRSSINVCGTDVEIKGEHIEIKFGDISTETDTPVAN